MKKVVVAKVNKAVIQKENIQYEPLRTPEDIYQEYKEKLRIAKEKQLKIEIINKKRRDERKSLTKNEDLEETKNSISESKKEDS